MARHRLVNCEFLNSSSFKSNVSNKAKLLYLTMILNGDDRGFVDTTNDLINALTSCEKECENSVSLDLLDNTYKTALTELIDKGYLYEFRDNHNNRVHLIRHWFYHNKLIKGLYTNYRNFLEMVHLENNEYVLNSKKPLKEDNINETNINENIPIETNKEEPKKELNEREQLLKELEIDEDDFPYEISIEQLRQMKANKEK